MFRQLINSQNGLKAIKDMQGKFTMIKQSSHCSTENMLGYVTLRFLTLLASDYCLEIKDSQIHLTTEEIIRTGHG